MSTTMQGTVHGRTIKLSEDTGLSDGQAVEVSVRPVTNGQDGKPGNGLLRTEGALASDAHWDAIMDEIARSRKTERRVSADEP